MRLFICALAFIFLPLGTAPAAANDTAPTQSFTVTDTAHFRELEKIHQEADELILQARFREAIQLYYEMIFMEPDDEWAYEKMGAAYLVLGDIPRAKNAFENALEIDPHSETAIRALRKIADPDSPAP